MTKRAPTVCVALLVLAGCGGDHQTGEPPAKSTDISTAKIESAATIATPSSPDRFEYMTFAPPDDVYDETLNRLGNEGWELVTARRARASWGEMAYEITMRRRVRAGQKATNVAEQTSIALEASLQNHKRKLDDLVATRTTPTAPQAMPAPAPTVAVASSDEWRRLEREQQEHRAAYEQKLDSTTVYTVPGRDSYHTGSCDALFEMRANSYGGGDHREYVGERTTLRRVKQAGLKAHSCSPPSYEFSYAHN